MSVRVKKLGIVAVIILFFMTLLSAVNFNQSNASVLGLTEKLSDTLIETLEVADEGMYHDVIVVFDDLDSVSKLDDYSRSYHSYDHLPFARILLNQSEIADISEWNEVRYIEPNQSLSLFNAEGREMTGVDDLQDSFGYTGEGVEIAIIDTGLDGLHPDVQDNQVRNWQVAGTIVTEDNLYVSSTPDGIDLETSVFDIELDEGAPVNNDEYGHGTHVYGSIAGSGEASDGQLRGMAPDAEVHSYSTSTGMALVYTLEAYDHIIDLVKNDEADIRLISNSWGSDGCEFDPNNSTNIAAKEAYELGVLSVFAYGNEGSDSNTCNPYSASPYVLGIGATDKSYNVTDFSSRGKENGNFDREEALANAKAYYSANEEEQDNWDFENQPIGLYRPSVVAPGENIVSAQNPLHAMTLSGTYYGSASGTSMATPMVTGILTLVIDAYEQNNEGTLSPIELIRLLEVTANKDVMHGYEEFEAGAGFVDAKEAVERAIHNDIPDQVTMDDLVSFEYPENVVTEEGAYEGSVAPNSWETNEGYETHTFEVKEGALKAYADLSWSLELENIYISLYGPGSDVTDVDAADAQSAGLLDIVDERYVSINFPEPGTWTVRIDGRTNLLTSYEGKWQVEYPEDLNYDPEVALEVTPDQISGDQGIDVTATVTDRDGLEDIETIDLTVESANGNVLHHFTKADFTNKDHDFTLSESDLKMTAKAPWIIKLNVVDSAGIQTYEQDLVGRE
ncbi:S8 family peptidase [Alkalibacillus aidingensis]|uniref:S8 family peptidase n=1 Tax=Alkalibacillus aidingensis TaxID=2747607 RepID=UPI001660197A|nr:S8 family serine peptidase [Alkalibacillus aidingensis]